MKIDSIPAPSCALPRYAMNISSSPVAINWESQAQLNYQPNNWVQLLKLPSLFSFDEALLLCQQSEDEWIAWVPDHGEVLLHTSQFYCAS